MTTTANRCDATTASGKPCLAYACEGSRFCFWHDPEREAARQEARKRGGKARQGRSLATTGTPGAVQIREVRGVLPLLDQAVRDVLELENSVARARTIGYLVTVALKALELTTLEDRVSALENALAKR